MAADATGGKDVFSCPACGQRHRASLSALREGRGSQLRATCSACREAMLVEWRDGAPAVRLAGGEASASRATPVPAGAAAPAVATAASAGGTPAEARAATRAAPPPDASRGPALRAGPTGSAKKPRSARPEGSERLETPEPEVQAEFPPGTRIGRYELAEAIGHGGTGSVYRAFDSTTNRYVALKILAKELRGQKNDRFLREIEVQANLRHPHVMPVFDRGEHDGRPYFTMELLYRPFTLTDVIALARDGTLFKYATLAPLADLRQLVRTVLLPVSDGIYVSNVENGVIHRDLKPDNVLIDSRTLRAYVIDFGICHVIERPGRSFQTTVVAPTTEEAGIVGTPRFLAPEQARGSVHERTDVWGLGAILRTALTGEPPIAAASAITRAELRRRIEALREAEAAARAAGDEGKASLCAEKLARLEDQGVRPLDAIFQDARAGTYVPLPEGTPEALASIVHRAMAVRPTDRYGDARAFAADLQAWLAGAKHAEAVGGLGPSVRRRAAVRSAATLAAILGAGALGFGLGWVLAPRGREAVAQARAAEATSDVRWALARAQAMSAPAVAATRSPRDAALAHDLLKGVVDDAARRLEALGEAPGVEAARAEARAAAARLAPAEVRWSAPGEPRATLFDLVRDVSVETTPGTLSLAPGEYRLVLSDAVRVPLRVPFRLRPEGGAAPAGGGLEDVVLPLAPGDVPEGYALVLGGRVEPRGAPVSAAIPAAQVAPFLLGRTEVRNREYSAWLETIVDEKERAARVPAEGFEPDAREPGHFRSLEGFGDLPVVGVSGDDAAAYLAWRSTREGAVVRLPTEAEWVLAAGGALDGTLLASGSSGDLGDPTVAAALTGSLRSAEPAAGEPAEMSPYGAHRMLGNARELVTALEGDAPYLAKGAAVGDQPVEAAARIVRPVARGARDPRTGFRAVRELPR
jgi:serine/threonine protein kinase/formylglycine-generating enzyme required for sulfatase activity